MINLCIWLRQWLFDFDFFRMWHLTSRWVHWLLLFCVGCNWIVLVLCSTVFFNSLKEWISKWTNHVSCLWCCLFSRLRCFWHKGAVLGAWLDLGHSVLCVLSGSWSIVREIRGYITCSSLNSLGNSMFVSFLLCNSGTIFNVFCELGSNWIKGVKTLPDIIIIMVLTCLFILLGIVLSLCLKVLIISTGLISCNLLSTRFIGWCFFTKWNHLA